MSNIVVVTDSGADLPKQICAELGIIIVPLYVNWGGKTYKDGVDLDAETFYARLQEENELPSTSQLTPATFQELFNKLLAEGKDVLCLTLSSGLSGTYNSAAVARGMLENPDRVAVVDSLAASMGQGILAVEAARMAKQGLALGEIVSQLQGKISCLRSIFTLNTLQNLVKGGRLSAFQGSVATLLDIKPILHLDEQGKIVGFAKVRSRKKALAQLEEEVLRQGKNLPGQVMGLSHAHDPETGEEMARILKEKFGAAEVIYGEIGPVIGTHTGQGCIAIFFYGEPMR